MEYLLVTEQLERFKVRLGVMLGQRCRVKAVDDACTAHDKKSLIAPRSLAVFSRVITGGLYIFKCDKIYGYPLTR